MTNSEYVEKLYKKENQLRFFCSKYRLYDYDDQNDLLQDLYIKLLEFKNIDDYLIDNEPKMWVIEIIIRNNIFNLNKKHYIKSVEYNDEINVYDDDNEDKDVKCIQLIYDEIEKIESWYDRKIVEIYIKEKHSIRSLSRVTKIPYHFIQPSISKFKKQVNQSVKNLKNQNDDDLSFI